MTLDERIEALTQTVELLASMQKDNETRFARVDSLQSDNEKRFEQLASAAEKNEGRIGQLMDTMNRVGRILEAYDDRLDELDRRTRRLERPGA